MSDAQTRVIIRRAFQDAQSRRPYKADAAIIEAATPPGGEWRAEATPIGRRIVWGGTEVAHVNPSGALDDLTEGDIAMALRATPLMDAALRSIIVLAENPDNASLIRTLAISAIAFVEMPAPRIPEPDSEEDGDDGEPDPDAEFPFSGSF